MALNKGKVFFPPDTIHVNDRPDMVWDGKGWNTEYPVGKGAYSDVHNGNRATYVWGEGWTIPDEWLRGWNPAVAGGTPNWNEGGGGGAAPSGMTILSGKVFFPAHTIHVDGHPELDWSGTDWTGGTYPTGVGAVTDTHNGKHATYTWAGGWSVPTEWLKGWDPTEPNGTPNWADGGSRSAMSTAGKLARWLGASIRLWVDLRDLPAAPPPTGDIAKDFANVATYDEALAQFALTAELIDSATHIVERAVRDGAQLKEPTPELLKKVRPFLRSGVSFLAALRTLPPKPVMTSDTAKNLANLVMYRTALAQFAIETDLADSSAELAGMLFEAVPKLQMGAGASRLLSA